MNDSNAAKPVVAASPKRLNDPVKVTPGHGVAGRHPTRQMLRDILDGNGEPGMFGQMFPMLDPLEVSNDKLVALADAMMDEEPPTTAKDNPTIPSGFTYFGQFVDHDITLDLTSLGDKQADPKATENFRTPSCDLDSLYGLGPDGSPHLYARDPDRTGPKVRHGPKFLIGKTVDPFGDGVFDGDVPRSPQGFALIGDPRNDENLLVQQTHLAMLKFHNKVCDKLVAEGVAADDIFEKARQVVVWHYQWIVLHDWVDRLTAPGTVDKILRDGRKWYRFRKFPFMPVEFSGAAYRLGHSMVREHYSHNRNFPNAPFLQFFTFSGLSGIIHGPDFVTNSPQPFTLPVFPSNWIIDWRRFHEVGDSGGAHVEINHSRLLDPLLAKELHTLPGGGGNLALRNLQRGVQLGLPSGQAIARYIGVKVLTPQQIATGPDGAVAAAQHLDRETPLWYYILKEAEVLQGGKRLGPVGSAIVAETFVGLIHGDRQSFLWREGRDWRPTLPSQVPGTFTFADLLRFVDDINPLGDVAPPPGP